MCGDHVWVEEVRNDHVWVGSTCVGGVNVCEW